MGDHDRDEVVAVGDQVALQPDYRGQVDWGRIKMVCERGAAAHSR